MRSRNAWWRGYNPAYGARPLRRAVMRLLEDSLAEEVLSGRIKDGDHAEVDVDDDKKVVVDESGQVSLNWRCRLMVVSSLPTHRPCGGAAWGGPKRRQPDQRSLLAPLY